MEPLTAEERERLNQIPHLLKGCNCGNCEVARKAIALCDEAARLQGVIAQWRQVAGTCTVFDDSCEGGLCWNCGHFKPHHDLLARLMEEGQK